MSFLVTSGSITSGLVTSGRHGDASVLSGTIGSGQIASGHLASGLIAGLLSGSATLTSGQVTSGFLGNASVVSGSIASGQVSHFHIAANSIQSGQVQSGALTSGTAASGFAGTTAELVRENLFTSLGIINPGIAVTFASSGVIKVADHQALGGIPAFGVNFGSVVSGTSGTLVYNLGLSENGIITLSGTAAVGFPVVMTSGGSLTTLDKIASGVPPQIVGVVADPSATPRVFYLPGLVTSGSIFALNLASGAVVSGAIASGQVSQFSMASGAINSGQIGSGAITGFGQSGLADGVRAIGSGQVGGFDIANFAVNSGQLGPQGVGRPHLFPGIVSPGFDATLAFGTAIPGVGNQLFAGQGQMSGGAVAFSTNASGFLTVVPAERQSGLRLPCIGVMASGSASGQNALVVTNGFVAAQFFMASGFVGQPVYVGSGGFIVTQSGGLGATFSGAAQISGSVVQRIGVLVSGGMLVNVDMSITSGFLSTAQGTF